MTIKWFLFVLCSVFIVGCSQSESPEQLFYEGLTKSTVEAAMAKTVNKPSPIKLTVPSSTPTPDMVFPFITHVYTKIVKDGPKKEAYNQPIPVITPLHWCCITQEANLKKYSSILLMLMIELGCVIFLALYFLELLLRFINKFLYMRMKRNASN
jgi:hypothetical protein